jgi:hypothetical protein
MHSKSFKKIGEKDHLAKFDDRIYFLQLMGK